MGFVYAWYCAGNRALWFHSPVEQGCVTDVVLYRVPSMVHSFEMLVVSVC